MIDPNKVTEAVSEFLQNPGWNDVFTNAPGGAMERLAISFYFSKHHESFKPEDFVEYRDLREEIERSLDDEDLEYLIENTEKPEAKRHYEELLEKLNGGDGKPKGLLRFDGKDGEEGQESDEKEESELEDEAREEGEEAEEKSEDGDSDGEAGEDGKV